MKKAFVLSLLTSAMFCANAYAGHNTPAPQTNAIYDVQSGLLFDAQSLQPNLGKHVLHDRDGNVIDDAYRVNWLSHNSTDSRMTCVLEDYGWDGTIYWEMWLCW